MKVYTCALLAVVLMVVAKESSAADWYAQYKGCYAKHYGDPYFPYSLVDRKMSNDMCVQHCKAQGKAYAATKSVRCGCGTEEHVAEMTKVDERQCSYNCKAGGGTCGGYARLSVYSTAQGKRMLNLREVLGDLTDTLEKRENAYKREMGETGDFEEEMRDLEDMEADDMFEDEE
ncbi:Hypp9205 [Branchiostoma lanceolatum]|uniref:Hypp9205 protein n=1 Tax=Branchiostoma lanceolatum TaxID=7740 RepID=A0A8K0EKF6_BRALA|nr:Hypp9205 [Branchiostoma lanceolatum]